MKKLIIILVGGAIFLAPSLISSIAYGSNGYIMTTEPCNSGEGTFEVCRPLEESHCNISDQTLC